MAANTKARAAEILSAAQQVVSERQPPLFAIIDTLPLAKEVADHTGCHINSAKRAIDQALRLARGEQAKAGRWGGDRGGGRRPGEGPVPREGPRPDLTLMKWTFYVPSELAAALGALAQPYELPQSVALRLLMSHPEVVARLAKRDADA